jgi:hypothetical protein
MPPLPRRLAPGLAWVVLLAALGWTGWALAAETARTFAPRPSAPLAAPHLWSLRDERVAEMRSFLGAAQEVLPDGAMVAVASAVSPRESDFFFYLWAAYLLPRQDVVRLTQRWTWDRASYVLVHRLPESRGAWRPILGEPMGEHLKIEPEPLLEHPQGVVYRIRRP